MKLKTLKKWLELVLILQTSVTVQLILAYDSKAQNNLQKPIFNFGYSPYAYPASSLAQDSKDDKLAFDTFCYQLYVYLQKYFENQYQFKLVPTYYYRRFGNKETNNLDIACGSSSITSKRLKNLHSNGFNFSIIYFETETKYLVKKTRQDVKQALDNQTDLNQDDKIAVLEGTTQHEFLEQTDYRDNINILKNREDLNEELGKGEITAYISDEIILKGILYRFKDIRNKYELISKPARNEKEKYGIVIYNRTLDYVINSWILDYGKSWMEQKDKDLNQFLNINQPKLNIIYLQKNLRIILPSILVIVVSVCLLIILSKYRSKLKQPDDSKELIKHIIELAKLAVTQNPNNTIINEIKNIAENYQSQYDQRDANIGANFDTAQSGSTPEVHQYNNPTKNDGNDPEKP